MTNCRSCKTKLTEHKDYSLEDVLTEEVSIVPLVWECTRCNSITYYLNNILTVEYSLPINESFKYVPPVTDVEALIEEANETAVS